MIRAHIIQNQYKSWELAHGGVQNSLALTKGVLVLVSDLLYVASTMFMLTKEMK